MAKMMHLKLPNQLQNYLKIHIETEVDSLKSVSASNNTEPVSCLPKSLTINPVSGGGGWGAKKGLLSLDPQESHVPLSEEEEMERFMKTIDGSAFAPPGSSIQFFVSPPTIPASSSIPSDLVLGVSAILQPSEGETIGDGEFIEGHFGAMSSTGLFLESPLDKVAGVDGVSNTKLTVPQSLVYVA